MSWHFVIATLGRRLRVKFTESFEAGGEGFCLGSGHQADISLFPDSCYFQDVKLHLPQVFPEPQIVLVLRWSLEFWNASMRIWWGRCWTTAHHRHWFGWPLPVCSCVVNTFGTGDQINIGLIFQNKGLINDKTFLESRRQKKL